MNALWKYTNHKINFFFYSITDISVEFGNNTQTLNLMEFDKRAKFFPFPKRTISNSKNYFLSITAFKDYLSKYSFYF